MQGASASCHGPRDPDPGPQAAARHSSSDFSLPPPVRPSIALELFDRFVNTQTSTDRSETEDDVTMTEIADNHSFVPIRSLPPDELPDDEFNVVKVRKRNNLSPTTDSLTNNKKKGSGRNTSTDRLASPTGDNLVDPSS